MSDSKLSQLDELVTPAGEDLLLVTDNPSGTPSSKKITLETLFQNIPVKPSVDSAINIKTATTPASSIGADGDEEGDISWDADYLYVCTADYDGATDVWKRLSLVSW